MRSGRGGKRTPGAGKTIGRPVGTTKDDAMREQLAVNCDDAFKQRVIRAANRAGYAEYSKWLRVVIDAAVVASECAES